MKKTISTWWPVAILLPIAHTSEDHRAALRDEAATQDVSAELARAISFGLVGGDEAVPATSPTHPAL